MLTTPAFRVLSSSSPSESLSWLAAPTHTLPRRISPTRLAETAAISSTAALASPTCTPGATRECKTFWYDSSGQTHCKLQSQLCRADGYAWQACGDMDGGGVLDAGAALDAGRDEDAGQD